MFLICDSKFILSILLYVRCRVYSKCTYHWFYIFGHCFELKICVYAYVKLAYAETTSIAGGKKATLNVLSVEFRGNML